MSNKSIEVSDERLKEIIKNITMEMEERDLKHQEFTKNNEKDAIKRLFKDCISHGCIDDETLHYCSDEYNVTSEELNFIYNNLFAYAEKNLKLICNDAGFYEESFIVCDGDSSFMFRNIYGQGTLTQVSLHLDSFDETDSFTLTQYYEQFEFSLNNKIDLILDNLVSDFISETLSYFNNVNIEDKVILSMIKDKLDKL